MITNAYLQMTAGNIAYGTATESKAITCVYLCNVTTGPVTVNVYVVPAGANYVDCKVYNNLPITSEDTVILDSERMVLGNGDAIWADCTVTNGVVMTISSMGV